MHTNDLAALGMLECHLVVGKVKTFYCSRNNNMYLLYSDLQLQISEESLDLADKILPFSVILSINQEGTIQTTRPCAIIKTKKC